MSDHNLIELLAAMLGLAAAVCWIRSATVRVKAEHQSGLNAAVVGGYVHFTVGKVTYDLHKSLRLQSRWNAWAAFFAAAVAIAQAASVWRESLRTWRPGPKL
jgi:hypothetical protein